MSKEKLQNLGITTVGMIVGIGIEVWYKPHHPYLGSFVFASALLGFLVVFFFQKKKRS